MSFSCLTTPDIRRVTVFIYALCEPTSEEVRYIGRTQDVSTRVRVHRYQGSRAVREWFRLVKKPVVRVLCEVPPGKDAAAAEREALAKARSCRLLNIHGRSK